MTLLDRIFIAGIQGVSLGAILLFSVVLGICIAESAPAEPLGNESALLVGGE